jgi:hypothetical protein
MKIIDNNNGNFLSVKLPLTPDQNTQQKKLHFQINAHHYSCSPRNTLIASKIARKNSSIISAARFLPGYGNAKPRARGEK